ncbi:hypothetical protein [Flavobacterium gilvum]|uniref:Uncharacterized protein n=1 Tax=Flavobacterium gilvum TaxID=1492737 RepID=A0AAC9I2J8_9FLAO|nr:hypothetical protein [Flavobacterium gilvum]AOW08810.1 hypothetical protein EM308_04435 [Flavobacterium gilvum]KFC61183.1 hypothetical protein FEM08_00220 [Flavobacterium gilvum]
MKINYLFPHRFKKFGWIVFISVLVFYVLCLFNQDLFNDYFEEKLNFKVFAIIDVDFWDRKTHFFKMIKNNIIDELILCPLIISGILVGFSKVKVEDEMVSKIRLESLVWATYVNYVILLFGLIFVYGMTFLDILYANIFSLLLFFIILFHWKLYQYNKMSSDEE